VAECQPGSECNCAAPGRDCLPWGRWNGLAWQQDRGHAWYDLLDQYSDGGPAAMVGDAPTDESLKGAWRTPSLRDVALTAPYMHDGAYQTLPEVVRHYNTGGRLVTGAVGRPAVKLRALGLDPGEVEDLVAFLETLTGEPPPAALREAPPAP
jgi:cytochrome c peroxidase